jgi:GxxExxY protein
MSPSTFPHEDITYRIIGAAMRVHRRTVRGLREKHYQRALTAELLKDGLTCPEEYHIEIYDGQVWMGRLYLDHWVNNCVVVETKAFAHALGDQEVGQVITYLAALDARVGLLLNFGRPGLEHRRILPPKTRVGWTTYIGHYLWRPDSERSDIQAPSAPPNVPPDL